MNLVKLVEGKRLDYQTPNHNCAGCMHKVGRVCDYHHATLQSNTHRPTDCKRWFPIQFKKEEAVEE